MMLAQYLWHIFRCLHRPHRNLANACVTTPLALQIRIYIFKCRKIVMAGITCPSDFFEKAGANFPYVMQSCNKRIIFRK